MSINQNELQKLGNILKSKREDLGLSLKHISEATKIRYDYLQALEEGDYENLPADVYTKGFVRNYSLYLGINPKITLAFFRRENIKPNNREVIRKPAEISSSKFDFQITGEKILYSIVAIIIILFLGYIIFRVTSVVQKPEFTLSDPVQIAGGGSETFETTEENITIRGSLEVGAELSINGSDVDTRNLEIFEIPDQRLRIGENIFNLKAVNQFGIEEVITLRVVREQDNSQDVNDSVEEVEETITTMNVEVQIGPRESNLIVIVDGEEVVNWVEPSGTVKTFQAQNSFSIQTPRPDSVQLAINGEVYEIDSSDIFEWILLDGQVVRRNN